MADLPATQQRDVIGQISPPWLASGNNERYMYNLGLACDALLEKMNQASKAHMPGYCTPTALPILGRDRVLSQGPAESDDDFAIRLQRALDTWGFAGNRRAIMGQAITYLGGYAVEQATNVPIISILSVARAGAHATWDTYYSDDDSNNAPSHVRVTPANWQWGGPSLYYWWWAWLVYFVYDGSTLGPEETWGNGTWGESGGSWGFNCESDVFTPLRALVRLWKSANTFYPFFVFSFVDPLGPTPGTDGSDCCPYSTTSTGNADGTWYQWGASVAGCVVPSAPDNLRFVDGTAIYQDCFTPTGT